MSKEQDEQFGELSASRYTYKNVDVTAKQHASQGYLRQAENTAFRIILDGHFYLRDSSGLDPQPNLEKFLHRISISSIRKGLSTIGGGMFNLFIVDKERQRMVIAGDRFGFMPLYFMKSESGLLFSGNQFAFRRNATLFDTAIIEFLKYGYLPFSPTLYNNVERLLPGQVLEISLESGEYQVSNPAVFEFKPASHRINGSAEGAEHLQQTLGRFFRRINSSEYFIIDSEEPSTHLSTAWLRDMRPRLLTRRESGSSFFRQLLKRGRKANFAVDSVISRPGVHEAQPNPASLYRLLHSFEFGEEEYFACTRRMSSGTMTLCTLLGRTAFASDHYVPARTRFADHLRYIRQDDVYNTPIRGIEYYQQWLYNLPGAIPDRDLGAIAKPDMEVWFLNASRGILEVNRNAGQFHEDFIESLINFTEIRCLDAALPVALNSESLCSSPFLDYDVIQACYDLDKSIRAGNRVYNYYWCQHFPELSRLPWPGSSAKPAYPAGRYRLHQTISERGRYTGPRREENLDAPSDSAGRAAIIKRADDSIPGEIVEAIAAMNRKNALSVPLLQRFAALNYYLHSLPSE